MDSREPMDVARLIQAVRGPGFASVPTPAPVLDPIAVMDNVDVTLQALGSPEYWRPHFKTARTGWTAQVLLARGVTRFKASTISELTALLLIGATDILLAVPSAGPTPGVVSSLSREHPAAEISVLVDDESAVGLWPAGTNVFIDLDTGMRRSGLPIDDYRGIHNLARCARAHRLRVRGLHLYDGHLADTEATVRSATIDTAATRLTDLLDSLRGDGFTISELVLGGSHTFLDWAQQTSTGRWPSTTFGAGTVVYNDARSLQRFASGAEGPAQQYRSAVGVACRVVSCRGARATVDAGLTAVQVDAGRPHAVLAGRDDLEIVGASQEHLVLSGPGTALLRLGDPLVLVPRHIDTALAQSPILYRLEDDGRFVGDRVVPPRGGV